MNVVCVRWGDKYASEYVTRLQAMCAAYLPAHRFICFTDEPLHGVECRPLPSELPTWWSKLGLFKPGLLTGDTLYLDLDVVLTGSLQPFFDAFCTDPAKLWALDDFSYSLRHPKQLGPEMLRKLGGPGTVNSSVMLWCGDAARRVWDDFDPALMDVLHGDQNWITRCLWPDGLCLLPEGVAGSFKYGRGQRYPVTVFHGSPKPHEVTGWWT